ncbi:MAG TPA: hypothetical protein VHL80_16970 [Polyangia bacterium]|nr:hypothetical protein [Polyangia bacterium]
MRKSVRVLGTFGLSAMLAFLVAFPGVARSSSVQTVKWVGCSSVVNGGIFICPLVHSSAHPLSSLVQVYFDFVAIQGTRYIAHINKYGPTGTYYDDEVTFTASSTGEVDITTYASNVLANPNEYDELVGQVIGGVATINGRGMAEVTSF